MLVEETFNQVWRVWPSNIVPRVPNLEMSMQWTHILAANFGLLEKKVGICPNHGGGVFPYPKVATIPKWVAALWKNVEWQDGKNTNLEFMTLALQRDMRDMWLQEVCCFPMARYLWFSTTKQIDKMHLIKICAMKGWLKVSWASDPPMM